MTRLKGIIGITILTIVATLLSAGAALAAPSDRYDDGYDGSLDNYEIIIGDGGDRYDGWEGSETRTYVRVKDSRGRIHDGYYDSIAAMFYVLKERYGTVRVLDFEVPEFAGHRYERSGDTSRGLIDGTQAYYFWDYDRRARGGVPLILAFYDHRDAREEAHHHNGEIMDFDELIHNLKNWYDMKHQRVYWRGHDSHRSHWDNHRWNSAWDHRWNGYGWDRNDGWALRLNIGNDGVRGGDVRYRNNGVNVRVRGTDRNRNNNSNNGRGNGGRARERGNDDRNDDRDRNNDDGKYKREKKRERNR